MNFEIYRQEKVRSYLTWERREVSFGEGAFRTYPEG